MDILPLMQTSEGITQTGRNLDLASRLISTLSLDTLAELVDDCSKSQKLLLMDAPSFILTPSAPVLAMRSDPARSTRVSVDTQTAPPSVESGSLLRLSTTCICPHSLDCFAVTLTKH